MTVDEVLVWHAPGRRHGRARRRWTGRRTSSRRRTRARSTWRCTNNTARTPSQIDAANPRAANKRRPRHRDQRGARRRRRRRRSRWKILIVCGDPDGPEHLLRRLRQEPGRRRSRARTTWRSTGPATCGSRPTASRTPSGYDDALLAVPVRGPERGRTQQFLAVPTGAETCGPVVGYDDRTVLVAVQHPGDVSGASPAAPASLFPYDGTGQPRPSVIQIRRADGGAFLA